MKPRRLAVFGLTAGLLGGGAAGLLMTGTTLASAQTAGVTGTVTDPAAADPNTDDHPGRSGAGGRRRPGSGGEGRLGQGGARQARRRRHHQPGPGRQGPRRPPGRPAGPRTRGKGGRHMVGKLDGAASVLGMTAEELRTALEGGKSLAAIAQEKGIDAAKVVDALVAQFKTHLDEHVASGKNTQAEADQMLADARTRIEAFVNGTAPAGGPGFGFGPKGGRHFRGGPMGGAPAPSSSSSSSGTTTS